MIDVNTASAAMSKIRSPAVIWRLRIRSEKAIVATPLGPNQPMNSFAEAQAHADQRDEDRQRADRDKRRCDDADGGPAVVEERGEREQRAEDDEDSELDDLDQLARAILEAFAEIGSHGSERDRADEHGDEAIAVRDGDGDGVGAERDAERVERLPAGADLVAERAAAREKLRGDDGDDHADQQPDADVLEHDVPPDD